MKMPQEIREIWLREQIDPDRCTCNDCVRNEVCIFKFDLYNFENDCLELK